MAYKFLVVEDHAIVRQGLRASLTTIGGATAEILEAATIEKAILQANEHGDLDLVVLDLNLPDSKSVSSLVSFKRHHPDVPVIVLSGEDDTALIQEIFSLGALGYVPKTSSTKLIRHAIEIVLEGGLYLPPEVLAFNRPGTATVTPRAKDSSQASAPAAPAAATISLQARQRDVLRLVNQGLSNKEISRQLDISIGTTKNYIAALLHIFGVTTRSQLICLLRDDPSVLDG